jgi:hypothetical protein
LPLTLIGTSCLIYEKWPRAIHVPHTQGSSWPRGRHGTRRGRSPGAPPSPGRAPSGWDPGVCRGEPLAPDEPPQTAGRGWKDQELPATILLMCSVCKRNVISERSAALHGVGGYWTGGAGWGRVTPQGGSGVHREGRSGKAGGMTRAAVCDTPPWRPWAGARVPCAMTDTLALSTPVHAGA